MSRCPVDYGLCDMVVTVYHREGDAVTKVVHERAFFDQRRARKVDREGAAAASSFLLVIPGDTPAVQIGDKVMLGEGPEVQAEDWARFIPSLVPGLVVVSHVDVKYWRGRPVHTEAGGTMLRFNNLAQNR
ncbi:MAG: hypothetical protein IJW45_05400 [Oscillospiraceae bacterium]|nr:hypothetical protein [Oscillospiraceae bacterium]